jgi:putative heme-binding domain-containing protein
MKMVTKTIVLSGLDLAGWPASVGPATANLPKARYGGPAPRPRAVARQIISYAVINTAFLLAALLTRDAFGNDNIPAVPTLEQQLLQEDIDELAREARAKGEPTRGAILFYQQHLTCTKCHTFGEESSPLGPDLTKPEKEATDVFLVESILQPSKEIRKGYESVVVITDAGKTVTGLLVKDHPDRLVLRDPAEDEPVTISKDEIDEQVESEQSVMTPALVNQLANRQQFLDLVRYVMEITEGGPQRALELEPEPSLYAPPPLPEYEKRIDHAGMIADLDQESFQRGEAIYDRLCVNCHGTKDRPGSLPTSLRFASDSFRNGSDPHSMYKTLTHGFGLMVPQAWMVPEQKYDVIHYIREAYLRQHNPVQYVTVDRVYLAGLPKGDTRGPAPSKYEPWVAMDYGPNLIASYEIGTDASNFAYKGIAVRLDAGPGGVTRGRYWMIYDEDTLRVAAGWSEEGFIDYNAIMLNGKHAVHPRIVGRLHFENKTGPGWGNPETGNFEDPRLRGRDDRPYGPLPRDWAHYQGLYHHGNRVIVSYTVGETEVLEMPGIDDSSSPAVFTRTMNIGPRLQDMILQVAEQPVSRARLHSPGDTDPGLARIAVYGPEDLLAGATSSAPDEPPEASALSFDGATHVEIAKSDDFDMTHRDYSICARIKTTDGGTILCKTAPTEKWVPNGKSLFVRDGKLAFDIGWVGVVTSRRSVSDNRWHDVTVTYEHRSGRVRLFIDGRLDREGRLKPRGEVQGHVLRLGYTAGNFPEEQSFFNGRMSDLRLYQRALREEEIARRTTNHDPAEGLLARWQLGDAIEGTVPDATDGGYDGRVVRGKPQSTTLTAARGLVVSGISQPIEAARWQCTSEGQLRLRIPAGDEPLRFTLSMAHLENSEQLPVLIERLEADDSSTDLRALTRGGPARWAGTIATQGTVGSDDGPFAVDVMTHPATNPWFCRVRLTGFDFLPDGKRAAVSSWDGNVWLVAGIDHPEKGLTWQRIASGLFQPLGVKFVDGKIYVACRDQIAILHDLNGDGETDFYQNFNNDHQVTEHFHEFAMGLQTDSEGNFYYAKSARHALPAVVPHHGTLLRVSRDGSKTDILAKGFRAANGVCINPDGTFVVTDQEGHWCPENRINWVIPDGDRFYGNMYGYHDVMDPSDSVMEQPLCWINNTLDRSPAELLWVPSDTWGPLAGSLLNTSYGFGMVYVVPHERVDGQMQGGMCRLPIPAFPTGVMRGRFHPRDGQLYLCGMFAWAGSRTEPGGFYRLRYTGKPVCLPVGLNATRDGMMITFGSELDRAAAEKASNYAVKIWDLKRSANYGSDNYNERTLRVTGAVLAADNRTVLVRIPDIEPTWCMEIRYRLKSADGQTVNSMIHNTVHQLGEP